MNLIIRIARFTPATHPELSVVESTSVECGPNFRPKPIFSSYMHNSGYFFMI